MFQSILSVTESELYRSLYREQKTVRAKVFGANTLVVVEGDAPDAVLTSIGAHANYIVVATDSAAVPTWPGLDNTISVAARNKIYTYLTNAGYALRVTTSQTYRQALGTCCWRRSGHR